MKAKPRKIVYLELDNGKCPFEECLDSLKDPAFARAVDARLTRLEMVILVIIKVLAGVFMS